MKLKDVTPDAFVCHTSSCCPAVLETDKGSYIIIGKKLSAEASALVEGRVGADEYVIEVPQGMISGLK
jgi:hypothetical protein